MDNLNKDINGKESSKRYWAKRFFTLGYWIFIALFGLWFITKYIIKLPFEIPEALIDMWTWMMGFASAVVLGTVFERPLRKSEIDKQLAKEEEIPPFNDEYPDDAHYHKCKH